MSDQWAAFPDAPQRGGGLEITITPGPRAGAGADQWADFPDAAPPGRDRFTRNARLAGQFAQGTNDTLANAFGTPVDMVAQGLRAIGVPVGPNPIGGSESLKGGIDYVATLPGRVSDAVSSRTLSPLLEGRTSRFDPETKGERAAAGAGNYVGATLSMMLPAAGIVSAARGAATVPTAMQTAGQSIAAGVAPYVAPLAASPASQIAASAAGGAAEGATGNPLAGLAASLAVPTMQAGAARLASPVTNRLSAQEQRLVEAATREGIPLTPSQRTGSTTLRLVEETLATMPGSAGVMQGANQTQRQAFNRAAMSRAGATADDVSPDTIAATYRSLGQTFDDLAARTTIAPDSRFADAVERVANDYGRRLPTDVARVFTSYIDDLAPLLQAARTPGANPQITGEIYGRIRSDIGKTIRGTKDPQLKEALGGLQGALDDALERSASGPLLREWRDARRQYQALTTIDNAAARGAAADRAAADLPYGALTVATRAADKTGFARGRGQLNELARVGDYIAPRVPNSGTAQRAKVGEMLTAGASGIAGTGVAGAGGFTPEALAAGGALAATIAGVPYGAARLYQSGPIQAWLTNNAVSPPSLVQLLATQAAREGVTSAGNIERPAEANRRLARALMERNDTSQRR